MNESLSRMGMERHGYSGQPVDDDKQLDSTHKCLLGTGHGVKDGMGGSNHFHGYVEISYLQMTFSYLFSWGLHNGSVG